MTARCLVLGVAILLATPFWAGCSHKPTAARMEAWNAELDRLQGEQDSLRARAAELISKDPRILNLPPGQVVLAVPTAFVREVVDRLFRDVVEHVTLSLSGIKAHAAKKIKKVVTIGEFVVDVDIVKVVGRLSPGQPRITFGGDSIAMSLPISVTQGHGEADIHFVWNGKNVAGLACGDMDITQKVTGTVIPDSYVVSGALHLSKSGRRVVGAPHFPLTKLKLRVTPSQESWDAINAILDEKKRVCGWVLDKVDVPQILKNLAEEKGFNVRLPLEKLKPVMIPAGIQDSVTVGGKTLAISAKTNTVRIDPDAIWYSADVRLERAEPPRATQSPP